MTRTGSSRRSIDKKPNNGFYTYASGFQYCAAGLVSKMKLGNGRRETASYNSRLQITGIGLGITDSDKDHLDLGYDYGSSTQNNGSLRQPTIDFEGHSDPIEQNYTYDDLNRLNLPSSTSRRLCRKRVTYLETGESKS